MQWLQLMVKCVKSACYESQMKYGVYTILLNLLVSYSEKLVHTLKAIGFADEELRHELD